MLNAVGSASPSPAEPVVRCHLAAVASGDPDLMAADYADSAELVRPGARYRGRSAIRAYFDTVADRLGGGSVRFLDVSARHERATVRWRIEGGTGDGTTGTDHYVVRDGAIVRQRVVLDGADF